ncbi:hypothetical protein Pfo_016357 [Paulownia fortunei]|nr:hypothetical protein Pfo_016357 [Paulownia fortunei]
MGSHLRRRTGKNLIVADQRWAGVAKVEVGLLFLIPKATSIDNQLLIEFMAGLKLASILVEHGKSYKERLNAVEEAKKRVR